MAQLCRYTEELAQLGTEVLAASFSSQGYARRWIEETCSPFHLLLDHDRVVYRTYGLGSSLLKSWSPKIVWSYVKFLTSGRKWRGIQGNSGQMGGDFIIDAGGVVRLAYRSRDPADRPPVERLMDILRHLEQERE